MQRPDVAYTFTFSEQDQGQGWAFGQPHGLVSRHWPLYPDEDSRMRYHFTIRVPQEYRTRGPELSHISFFSYDDDADSVDIEAFEPHPQLIVFADDNDEYWAIIWQTDAEIGRGVDPTLAKVAPSAPAKFLLRTPREDDPNVGKDPSDDAENESGYIPMFSPRGEALNLKRFFDQVHFGGTASPAQAMPEGLSCFYFEFNTSLGEPNVGLDVVGGSSGAAQIDLLNERFYWAL